MEQPRTDAAGPNGGHMEEPLGAVLARIGATVLRRWRLFVLVVLTAAALGLIHWYRNGRNYVAESSFSPMGESMNLGQLSGLAAQFGFAMPFNQDDESLEFYAQLARSRDVLRSLATAEYVFPARPEVATDTVRGSLIELLEVKGRTQRRLLQNAVRELEDQVAVSLNARANLVTVRVTAPWPVLAETVNRRLLQEVNAYNLERRQSRTSAERAFAEEQARQAGAELARAESALETFLERNRRIGNAPQLEFQRDRLQRVVDLHQEIYTSLSQAAAEARIEEVRTTPVITVIESPEGAAKRTGNPFAALFFAVIPGLFVALAVVLGVDHLAAARRQNPEAFAPFGDLRGTLGRRPAAAAAGDRKS